MCTSMYTQYIHAKHVNTITNIHTPSNTPKRNVSFCSADVTKTYICIFIYIYISLLSLLVCPSKKEWLNNTAPDSVMHSPKKNICVKQHHHSGRQSFSKIICCFLRWTFLVCMRPTSILPAWSPPQMGRAHGSWGWFKSREAAVNRCGDEAAVDIQPGNHWKSSLKQIFKHERTDGISSMISLKLGKNSHRLLFESFSEQYLWKRIGNTCPISKISPSSQFHEDSLPRFTIPSRWFGDDPFSPLASPKCWENRLRFEGSVNVQFRGRLDSHQQIAGRSSPMVSGEVRWFLLCCVSRCSWTKPTAAR